MKQSLVLIAGVTALLAGCSDYAIPSVPTFAPRNLDTADLVLIRGFRQEGDPCKVTAETPYTNQFLSDSATLVSCPIEFPGRTAFAQETGARQVGQRGDFVLYTVPRR